jgi:hypothetical protein
MNGRLRLCQDIVKSLGIQRLSPCPLGVPPIRDTEKHIDCYNPIGPTGKRGQVYLGPGLDMVP